MWQEQYEDKKQDVEGEYSRLIEAVGGVAVEFEAACTKQRQREAAAVVGGAGVGPAGGGPAAAAGPGYRAERALCPKKLSVDCTGLEYRAFLRAWDSYYVASRFALAPVVTQIAYLTNCPRSQDLWTWMRPWSKRRGVRESAGSGLLSDMLRLLWHCTKMYSCKIENQNFGAFKVRSCQSAQMDAVMW